MKSFLFSTFVFFSFSSAFYCWLTQRRTREVLSWRHWHLVWVYHMCLRWNVLLFLCSVHICIQMTWSFIMCSCPYQKRWCYWIILISTSWSEHGSTSIKTKIKWDWRPTDSEMYVKLQMCGSTAGVELGSCSDTIQLSWGFNLEITRKAILIQLTWGHALLFMWYISPYQTIIAVYHIIKLS